MSRKNPAPRKNQKQKYQQRTGEKNYPRLLSRSQFRLSVRILRGCGRFGFRKNKEILPRQKVYWVLYAKFQFFFFEITAWYSAFWEMFKECTSRIREYFGVAGKQKNLIFFEAQLHIFPIKTPYHTLIKIINFVTCLPVNVYF